MKEFEKGLLYWSALARILVFGLLLIAFGVNGLTMLGDSNQYLRLADGILETGQLVDPDFPGLIEGTRPPGFPFLLSIFLRFGIPLWALSLILMGAAVWIPVFCYRIAGMLGLPEQAARIAGWFVAFEPLQVLYSVVLLTDGLGAFLFISAAYLLIRFWRFRHFRDLLFSAIIFGAMNYIRPIGLYLFLLIPAFLIVSSYLLKRFQWRQALGYAAVFGGLFYLMLSPWILRNYYHFGAWDFLSAKERHLYDYSAVAVRAAAEGTTYEEMRQRMRREILPLLPEPRDIRQFANREILRDRAIEIIRQHPTEYVKLYIFSLQTFLVSGNYHFLGFFYGLIDPPSEKAPSFTVLFATKSVSESVAAVRLFLNDTYGMVALGGRILWLLIFSFSLWGCWRVWRSVPEGRFGVLLYGFFILYMALITLSLVTGIEARHRLFANPFYFIFFSYAVWCLKNMRGKPENFGAN